MKNKKKWIVRGSILAAVILLLLTTMLLVQLPYHKALADLREKGYPTNLKELDAYYPAVPDEENAALDYEKAFVAYKIPENMGLDKDKVILDNVRLALGIRMPDNVLTTSRMFVDRSKKVLDLLEAGSRKSRCRFNVDFTKGYEVSVQLAHRAHRASCRLASTKAVLAAYDGNAEECARWLKVALSLSRVLHGEPLLISQLVDLACFAIAADTLEYSIGTVSFSDKQLAELSAAVNEAYNEDWYRTGMMGERAIHLDDWDGAMSHYKVEQSFFQRYPPGQALIKLKYLRLTEWLVTTEPGDYALLEMKNAEMLSESDQLSDFYRPCREACRRGFFPKFHGYPAQRALIQTIIAAERFRLNRGRLPASLDELVPEYLESVPMDPFTQKPLLMCIQMEKTGLDADFAAANPQCYLLDEFDQLNMSWDYYDCVTTKRYDAANIVAVRSLAVWKVHSVGRDLQDDGGKRGSGIRDSDLMMALPVERPK